MLGVTCPAGQHPGPSPFFTNQCFPDQGQGGCPAGQHRQFASPLSPCVNDTVVLTTPPPVIIPDPNAPPVVVITPVITTDPNAPQTGASSTWLYAALAIAAILILK